MKKRYPLRVMNVYGDRSGMPAAGAVFLAPIVHRHMGTYLRKSLVAALKLCNNKWPIVGPRSGYWIDLVVSGGYSTNDEAGDIALVKRMKAWSGNKYIWDFDKEEFVPLTGDDVA